MLIATGRRLKLEAFISGIYLNIICSQITVKLGVLFSGGKDSVFACYRAMQKENVACLITLVSENEDSYMFHTPNIR
jgi:hypothetical protein